MFAYGSTIITSGTATDNYVLTDVFVNGIDVTSFTGSNWSTQLLASSLYNQTGPTTQTGSIYVSARDSVYNTTAITTRTVVIDNTPPAASITYPLPALTYTSFSGITGTASDDIALQGVSVSIMRNTDGMYWDGTDFESASPVSFNLPVSGTWASWSYSGLTSLYLANGTSYTVKATAMDRVGNTSSQATVVFNFGSAETLASNNTIMNGQGSFITFPNQTLNLSYLKTATICATVNQLDPQHPVPLSNLNFTSQNFALAGSWMASGSCPSPSLTVTVTSLSGQCVASDTLIARLGNQQVGQIQGTILIPTKGSSLPEANNLGVPEGYVYGIWDCTNYTLPNNFHWPCIYDRYRITFNPAPGVTGMDLSGNTANESVSSPSPFSLNGKQLPSCLGRDSFSLTGSGSIDASNSTKDYLAYFGYETMKKKWCGDTNTQTISVGSCSFGPITITKYLNGGVNGSVNLYGGGFLTTSKTPQMYP